MKKMNKITFAAAALVVALGGGFVATNYASANSDVLEGLSIANGMSIRMNDPEGLRFSASINMTKAEMEAAGILEVGSVLMPADKVDGALEYNETNGSATALLIPTAKYYEETADVSSWFSALVNTGATGEFPVEFYNTPISARAYAKYSDTEYKYSEATITRSIGYVAAINYLRNVEDTFGVIAKIASQTEKEIVINAGDTLFVGEEYQATINVGGQALAAEEGLSVAWNVTGDAVTVDANGVVTPVQAGFATVEAVVAIAGGNSVTLTKEVEVQVATTSVNETYFAMKQTNDAGEIVTNNYTYELTDANVTSVSFVNGEALDASEYVVDGNTLTVYAAAFEEVAGTEATLKVETASENVEITFGRVATFAITKASDMNPGDGSVVPAWQVANGMPANWSDPRSTAHRFTGYTVVANDIDFGGANIKAKIACANAWGGTHYGFAGVFDGMGHTLKNFMVVGTNVSLFGRIDFGAAIVDTNFINFRTGGTASFGLFDATCYALLEDLTIDGTCDSTANNGSLLGNLNYVAGAGGVTMRNCTITARVGNVTETSNAVMGGGSSFVSVQNSTIYTQYKVPATFTTAGGAVEKLEAGAYYAMKVNGEAAHTLVTNDYVQAVAGTSLTSVTLYKNAGAIDLTASAELAGGNVVIPASAFASYTGRGAAIKVVTDEETKWFYQDIVTYAVTQASDLHWNNATGALSNMVAAGNLGNKTWAGYIVLGNNVDCSSLAWVNTGSFCGNAGSGSFAGTFDGRGYTISNINVDYSNNAWRQFFGSLSATAVVKNVSFVNAKAGWTTSYSFFGYQSQGSVDNVLIDVTPHKDGVTVFGRFVEGTASVTNCTIIVRNNADNTLTTADVIWGGVPKKVSNVKIYSDLEIYTKAGDVLPLSDYQA